MNKKNVRRAGRRFLSLILALTIVITTIAGAGAGPVGTAQAVDYASCGTWDKWAYVLSSPFGDWLKPECDPAALSDAYNDLADAHENATKNDLFSTASQTEADSTQYLAVQDNYLKDSGTPAMSKAEAAAVEAIDAGKSRAEVETAAVNAVEDYYSNHQINLADQWGVAAETVITMRNTSEVSSVNDQFVSTYPDDHPGNGSGTTYYTQFEQLTLRNGTTKQATQIVLGDTGGTDRISVYGMDTAKANGAYEGMEIEAYDDNLGFNVLTWQHYWQRWNDINNKSTQVEANAEVYGSALYNATVEGNESVTDYVSGSTLAEEFSTDHGDTGFYAYAVGYGATQGLAIPDLSNASLMEIQTATETYNGLLMSQEAPENGLWEVGVTYHSADLNGTQFVATADGEIIEIDGEFSIVSMEDAEGNEVQETGNREIEYTVTNETANYAELQDDLRALRSEIESLEPAPGSGGGGDSGGIGLDLTLGNAGWLIAVAVAAIWILQER